MILKECEILGVKIFMNMEETEQHHEDIKRIKQLIEDKLSANKNFNGFMLCDNYVDGINILIYHKKVKNAPFFERCFSINHDWDNVDEAVNKTVEHFNLLDNDVYINGYNEYLDDYEKYGADYINENYH